MPGAAIGRVMSLNRFHGVAPRSAAASSSWVSIPASLALTMNVTIAMENIACEMMSLTRPLLSGVMPQSTPTVTNHGRNETPSTISGVTRVSPRIAVSPNAHHAPFGARARATPPRVPKTVETMAVPTAACRLVTIEEMMMSLLMPLM